MQAQGWQQISLGRALIGPFTTLSLGAAAIHFAVTAEHFAEWWAFGLFFAAIGWFQALWPIAYLLRPSGRSALLAVVVNLATVLVWVWSRTIGLPFGPDPGMSEAVAWPDLLAGAFEVALVVGLIGVRVPLMAERLQRFRVSAEVSWWWTAGLAVLVALSSTVAITVGMGGK